MRSARSSAAGLPPLETLPANTRAWSRALATEIFGKLSIRIMREEPPQRGRYWNQKVLEPLGRMRTPKPLTSPSHRKTWPVLGRRTRFTLASVSFFLMVAPTAYRQRFAPEFRMARSGALWRDMPRNQGNSGMSCVFIWGGVAAQGAGHACNGGMIPRFHRAVSD